MRGGLERVHAHPGDAHRHPAHRFDAAGDDDVLDAGHDRERGVVDGLLTRNHTGGRS